MENSFSERLKTALKESGMRASQLAAATGLSKARISQYINGIYVPKSQAVYLLARTLNVREAWLIGEGGPMRHNTEEAAAVLKEKVHMIPIFENISSAFDENAAEKPSGYFPVLMNDENLIAVRASGDGMAPKLEEGDVIIVHKQDNAENGDISIVFTNSGYAVRKIESAEARDLKILGKVKQIIKSL